MPKDITDKEVTVGSEVLLAGKVIAASNKHGVNVLVETKSGNRFHVEASEIAVVVPDPTPVNRDPVVTKPAKTETAPAPAATPAKTETVPAPAAPDAPKGK